MKQLSFFHTKSFALKSLGLTFIFIALIGIKGWSATFTATSTGNWNVGATWGNTGNNVAGSGYPGASADIANIPAGITVTIPSGLSISIASLTLNSNTGNAVCGLTFFNSSSSLTLSGNFSSNANAPGSTTTRNSDITMNGGTLSVGGLMTLAAAASNDKIYNTRLVFTGGGNVTVNGNININSSGGALAVVDMTNGGTLKVGAAFTIIGRFTSGTGTVEYNNGTTQTVAASTYNNLALTGGGTKTLGGAITLSGGLTIAANITVNTSNSINIAGNWDVSGAFSQTAGTTTFTGGGTHTFSGTGYSQFNNLTTSSQTINAGSHVIRISGDIVHTSGTFNAEISTITLNGANAQSLSTSAPSFYNLIINKSAGTLSTTRIWTVSNNFEMQAGTLQPAGNSSFKNITLTGGTFTAPTGNITLSGNWTKTNGTFTPGTGTGTVNFNGGNQSISGSSSFNNLTKIVTSPATLTFAAGSTQTVTGTLTLTGTSGNLLTLASSTLGMQWTINPTGRNVNYVSVSDGNNIGSAISAANSFDGGNNINWTFPVKSALMTQPNGAVNGVTFTTQPVIQLQDVNSYNVSIAGVNVVASIASGTGGVLSGTTTVATNESGIATFTNLVITGTVGSFTLAFTPTNLTAATSNPFALTAGAATKGVLTTQPSGAVNGVALTTQPVVRLQDSGNNNVNAEGINVVASIATGTGVLSGTTTVATGASGIATFTNLVITGTAGNFTLAFTPASLTAATSSSFALTAGAANKGVLTTQPSGAVNGVALTTQPIVRLQDASNNNVSTAGINVVASIASGTGVLSGTTTVVTNTSGIATFTNLVITGTAGSFTLTFTPKNLTAATSNQFALAAGAADKLVFDIQPTNALIGSAIAPAITVQVQDASSNLVSTDTRSISLSIGTNPNSGTLSGLTTVNASGGIATFGNLSIDKAGTGYTLTASASGLSGTTSSAFDIIVKTSITSSGNWSTDATWIPSGVPTAYEDVIIDGTIIVDIPTATCKNLTINSGKILTIDASSAITVTAALENNGLLEINSSATNSGSLIVNGSSDGNVTYNRWFDPTNKKTSLPVEPGYGRWYIMSPPVNAGSLGATNTAKIHQTGTEYDFATYAEGSNVWSYGITSLSPGTGYLISLNSGSDGMIQFTGPLNNGNVTPTVTSTGTGNGWNAVGNPYTSAIKVVGDTGTGSFLDVNTSAPSKLDPNYAAIYVWNETGSYNGTTDQYYRIISNSLYHDLNETSLASVNEIQAGQGFLINTNSASTTLTFNKAMQLSLPGLSLKSAEVSWPGITLLAESKGQTRSTVVAFNEAMTTGLDVTYDAGLLASDNFQVYTHLVSANNPVDFAIQCLPDHQYSQLRVPVGVDLPDGGELVFKASGIILPVGIYPIIEDKVLGTQTALKTETDTYKVTLDKNTKGIGRFYLSMGGDMALSTIKPQATTKYSASFVNDRIVLNGTVEAGTKAMLFDISGRKLGEFLLENASRNEIVVAGMNQKVYLLKVEGKNTSQIIKLLAIKY